MITCSKMFTYWQIFKSYFPVKKQRISYNYNKGDYDKMRVEAGSINWDEIITGNDVETDWVG